MSEKTKYPVSRMTDADIFHTVPPHPSLRATGPDDVAPFIMEGFRKIADAAIARAIQDGDVVDCRANPGMEQQARAWLAVWAVLSSGNSAFPDSPGSGTDNAVAEIMRLQDIERAVKAKGGEA